MATTYDVVIIGSGPGGYVAAIRAGQLGLKTAIVEKDGRLGGTCLLRGCIPTKSMLKSAEVADMARHAKTFGITIGEMTIDMKAVLKRKDKVVKVNAGGVSFLMKKNKVDVFNGWGSLAGAGKVKVATDDGEQILNTKNIILATGSDPRVLPGFDIDGPVMTSDELLELDEIPKHLLVLGAGAVGVEFASVFKSFGSEVTVVELADRLVPIEDEDVSAEFEKIFKRRGIRVHTATKLTDLERTDDGGVRGKLEPVDGGQAQGVSASHFLLAVGRKPLTDGIGLEGTKVEVERGFVRVDPHFRTAEPGIYAIGDIVAGTPLLAHAASAEGVTAVEHIAGLDPPPINYAECPGCTYSSPEIGSIGLTEKAAREAGHEVLVGKFPFTGNGKAKVIDDTAGFVKIVAEKRYNQILGVHIIGPHATDLIAEAGPLIKLEYTVEELARTIHAHPTLSEAIHEAAHATLGHALHM